MKMMNEKGTLFLIMCLTCFMDVVYSKDLARGWGDQITWTDMESGLQMAKSQDLPMMLLIHKSWCGACKSLKPKFADSDSIRSLSSNFIMVNTLDDEEPKDQIYAPDGGYIPRLLFLSPAGKVMDDVYNEQGSSQYKYYYSNPDQIVDSMRRVIAAQYADSHAREDL